MGTLKTFWDTMIPYRTESVRFFVLMNSATKGGFTAYTLEFRISGVDFRGLGFCIVPISSSYM